MLFILLNFQDIYSDWFGSDTADLDTLQMMVRAVITFLIALVLIRIAGIRSFGSKSAFDIVLSITVGAILSRCISGHYSYIACIAASTVLALMHRLFAIISFYSPASSRLIKGKPDPIFRKGTINWKNMRKHNLTEEDLTQAFHKFGYMDKSQVEEAFFETDGRISVIPKTNS